jgi:Domain of unknown function (DUF4276)
MKIKKLALFVEGQTEQIFLKEFIQQIAGQGNITFDCQSAGSLLRLQQMEAVENEIHKVLIYDCRGDEAVKSVVIDQRPRLMQAGYTLILGIRDLYPDTHINIAKIKAKLCYGIPTKGIPTHILLAVAEIEAWFLQEHVHFGKIDAALDVTAFKKQFDFDPVTDCAEQIAAPAALLHSIYSTVGKAYKKTHAQVTRTVLAIDYENLYTCGSSKMPHMAEFIAHIENFLAPDFSN